MLNQMLANKDDIPTFENVQKTMHKNVVKYLGWVLVFDWQKRHFKTIAILFTFGCKN